MTVPLIRYQLDSTGANPNNLVVGEIQDLSAHQKRAIAPNYGPFFLNNFELWDHTVNVRLEKDLDYKFVDLLQDASADFGQEVYQMLIVTNPAVGNKVRITYQVLGGHYQNSAKAVADAFQAFLDDDRPVDWLEGVFGKPYTYPPSLHQHLLSDVVGFGALVVALERVAQAITLNNVPAFERLIDWVRSYVRAQVSEQEIIDMSPVDKSVTFDRLLFSAQKLNFNTIFLRPDVRSVRIGRWVTFSVESSNFKPGEVLFWSIRHETTEPDMFANAGGMVVLVNQQATFVVNTLKGSENYGDKVFGIQLRRNAQDGPVISDSWDLVLNNPDPVASYDPSRLRFGMWDTVCCLQEPGIIPSAEGIFLVNH